MADKTIVRLNWPGAEAAPGSPEAIARGCTCSWDLKVEPVIVAQPDCPLHGLQRIVEALRSGEAELEIVEVDLSTLGSVAGGAPWSAGDVAALITWARKGWSDVQVAAAQGRELREVQAKAAELGRTLRSGVN
jgi:hypothetical protein